MIILKSYNKFIFESKNYANLYHFTTIDSLYQMLKSNSFICTGNDTPHINSADYMLCLTRNKNMKWSKIWNVLIAVDSTKLSNNYKILPVRYYKDLPKTILDESEERVFTNRKRFPIFDYVVNIKIIIKDDFDYWALADVDNETVNYVCVINYIEDKLKEKNIPYEIDK